MREFNTIYESSWSSADNIRHMDTGDWRAERPIVNYDKCGQCGWCYLYCPVGCMVEENDYFVPNLDFCKGCGICARECPSQCITMVTEEVE